jgi:hypothetical protein
MKKLFRGKKADRQRSGRQHKTFTRLGEEEVRVRLCACQVVLLHRGLRGMENALCEAEFINGERLVRSRIYQWRMPCAKPNLSMENALCEAEFINGERLVRSRIYQWRTPCAKPNLSMENALCEAEFINGECLVRSRIYQWRTPCAKPNLSKVRATSCHD